MAKRRRSPAVRNLDTPAATLAELRSQLSTCTGKICAYVDVDKKVEAKEWAIKLVECLQMNSLITSAVLREL